MSAFYLLIGCSLPVAGLFLLFFIRATKAGQWDDVETPAMRMLHDDTIQQESKSIPHGKSTT
jgi:cbb3-type cytochrome oxidase maturation protein